MEPKDQSQNDRSQSQSEGPLHNGMNPDTEKRNDPDGNQSTDRKNQKDQGWPQASADRNNDVEVDEEDEMDSAEGNPQEDDIDNEEWKTGSNDANPNNPSNPSKK